MKLEVKKNKASVYSCVLVTSITLEAFEYFAFVCFSSSLILGSMTTFVKNIMKELPANTLNSVITFFWRISQNDFVVWK